MSRALMLRAAGLVTAAVCLGPPAAAQSPALHELEQKAYYWLHHGREDKAAEVWRKLLRSDPDHPNALCEMAMADVATGHVESARRHVRRLELLHPGDPRLASLRAVITVGADFPRLLREARRLGERGRRSRAVAVYRRAFGGVEPATCIAVEYYQTLAGVKGGWTAARRGLTALASRYPQAEHLQLALAVHLTYRGHSRAEGIASLAALARRPNLRREATAAWRQALLWLETTGPELALVREYLAQHPEDAELQRRLERLERRAAADRALRDGFDALAAGELERAERQFSVARETGGPPEALVGLATVALRRKEYARAKRLLAEVKRLAPERPELWRRSLASAELWSLIQEADELRQDGQLTAAKRLLLQARGLSAEEAFQAELALARLYQQSGDLAAAEGTLRRFLASHPDQTDAMRALVDLLVSTGRGDEASRLNDRLRGVDETKARSRGEIDAELLRGRGHARREAGDLEEARRLLVAATEADPANDWALLELADVNLELGETEEARRLVDGVRARRPDLLEAQLASARVSECEGDYAAGLAVLAAIDAGRLTPEARRLQGRLRVQADASRAVAQFFEGSATAARRELGRLEREVGAQADTVGFVALAWSRIGDHDHALALMRAAATRSAQATPTLRLQLAAVLLGAGEDAALAGVLRELETDPGLRPQEQRGLSRLRVATAVRRADSLREQGELDQALAHLAPLLEELPRDPDLAAAAARILFSAGNYTEAEATFNRLLADQPGNTEALYWATLSVMARRDVPRAGELVKRCLETMPDDPRTYVLAGRLAVMKDDRVAALEAFAHARLLVAAGPRGELAARIPASRLARSTRVILGQLDTRGRGPDAASLQAEIDREIAALRARTGVTVGGEVSLRNRGGEPGLQSLTELSVPASLRVPTRFGTLSFTATAVYLDAGELDLGPWERRKAFGSAAMPASYREQYAVDTSFSGAALSLGFAYHAFTVDVGSTPLGFQHETVVGGVRWQDSFGPVGLAVEVSRRPVTDSVLSYAGLEDPGTGKTWGAVVSQGGRVDLGYTGRGFSGYVFGGYHYLNGVDVASNHAGEGGCGVRWRLYAWKAMTLTTGLSASMLAFEKNLSEYTLGHGGYFSPQAFVHGGVPLVWAGSYRRLEWSVSAEPGANWLHLERADYYPTRPDLQVIGESHPGRSSAGFAFNGDVAVSYRITDGLEAGARASVHTGEDYREVVGGAFVGYSFARRQSAGAPSGPLVRR